MLRSEAQIKIRDGQDDDLSAAGTSQSDDLLRALSQLGGQKSSGTPITDDAPAALNPSVPALEEKREETAHTPRRPGRGLRMLVIGYAAFIVVIGSGTYFLSATALRNYKAPVVAGEDTAVFTADLMGPSSSPPQTPPRASAFAPASPVPADLTPAVSAATEQAPAASTALVTPPPSVEAKQPDAAVTSTAQTSEAQLQRLVETPPPELPTPVSLSASEPQQEPPPSVASMPSDPQSEPAVSQGQDTTAAMRGSTTTAATALAADPTAASTETAEPASSTSPPVSQGFRERGEMLLASGDIVSARHFFEYAAVRGDSAAARRAGQTYDPAFLRHVGARGVPPNVDKAAYWYRQAIDQGDAEAGENLKGLPGERRS